MARTKAGLTEPDIAALRQQLADGKRPRVQLSGPHFPVEAVGTVVRIGSPDTDGADYLRVRVKVNGMTDELAFSPGELSLRQRAGRTTKAGARPAKAAGRTARTSRPTPTSSTSPTSPTGRGSAGQREVSEAAPAPANDTSPPAAEPSATAKAPATKTPAAKTPATRPAASKAPATKTPAAKAPAKATKAVEGAAETAGRPAEPVGAGRPAEPVGGASGGTARRRKAALAAKVSFTVSSAGASWALTASRGNKSLVRQMPLPPGVVGAMAELLDQPALAAAVNEINDQALAEARARADRLRAELNELEAVLATHRRP